MKILLDTNVLLVVISRKSKFNLIWKCFLEGKFELCVTTDILNEYAEILEQKLRFSVAQNVMKAIEYSPDVLYITKYYSWKLMYFDPDDDKFVDCAVASDADFIVTNDKHFNHLKKLGLPRAKVVNDEAFLEILIKKYELTA